MTFFSKYAAFAAVLFLCFPAAADNAVPGELGPAVGETIPHDLSTTSASGVMHSFDTLVGENGLALFFVRSIDWCPFCQAQVIEVDGRAQEFKDRGLSVVFLSYDPPADQQEFLKRRKIETMLLSDRKSEIIDAFGLRNESYEPGSRGYGVPHPVIFIINSDKTVAAKLYEDDFLSNAKSYRNRPAVDIILDAADQAAADGKI
ncbi:MAG: peroxiredoxin family protein [Alphaproteobacteria bacterium]|nr:peroxiredoxin family protein [Alphaproteobacteria bacterium]